MIFLTKGQKVINNPGLVVYDQTGYYEDGDTVVCASVLSPEEPVCRYEAKYIAYGSMVYSVTNEEELMKEILKMDADTLFGKDRSQFDADQLLKRVPKTPENPAPVTPVTPLTPATPVASTTPTTSATTTPATPPIKELPVNTNQTTSGGTKVPSPQSVDVPTEASAIPAAFVPESVPAVDASVSSRGKLRKIAKAVKTATKNVQKKKKRA